MRTSQLLCLFAAALFSVVVTVADEYTLDVPLLIQNALVTKSADAKAEKLDVLIEDGRIAKLGSRLRVPAGARVIDATDLHLYAGFIDGWTRVGISDPDIDAADERRYESEFRSAAEGPFVSTMAANRNGVYPQRQAYDYLNINAKTFGDHRANGFVAALIAPPSAMLGGQTSLVALGEGPLRDSVIRANATAAASFDTPSGRKVRSRGRYPGTRLGVIAALRQAFYDAQWFAEMRSYADASADVVTVPTDPALAALQPVLQKKLPLVWEAETEDEIDRVLERRDEFDLRVWIAGARRAFRRTALLKENEIPVILSLKTQKEPKKYKFTPKKYRKAADDATLYGAKWESRPFQPAAATEEMKRRRDEMLSNVAGVEQAGLTWCVSTGDEPKKALENLHHYREAGADNAALLRALTETPAEMLGVDDQLGTVAVGKRAMLTVLNKPLGDKEARARFTIVDGKLFELPKQKGKGGKERKGRRKPRPQPEFWGHTHDHACGTEHGTADTFQNPEEEDAEAESEEGETTEASEGEDADDDADEKKKKDDKEIPPGPLDSYLGHEPQWDVENELDRIPEFKTGGDVLLRNATVLTVANGTLANASILLRDGKIAKIGDGIAAPDGVKSIDLSGYFVMPAIIDPHSHIAIDGTNEWSLSVTPEVRIDDVINSRSRRIYDSLTGGCTTIHAMHGSANVIGGQCRMLKLRNGTTANDMRLADAPLTVKFATGENVKQETDRNTLNRDDNGAITRFPKSRMGVEVVMRRALAAGKQYHDDWRAYEKAKNAGQSPEPMRRDLRLQALGDIVGGDIWINMHCYRADEVLRAMQVAEDFGVRMGALHHILEGYRIMPEIARHGCGTATFSDWWAYKVEAYDAVPHNAGMLLEAGVNSTIKSDSSDLMRHMNLEAAKCMQYSNLTSTQALELITTNAAKLFGLEDRLGSIEVGKDADLAVFDGHPLDTFAKCVLTTIDGEVYFVHPEFDPTAPNEDATRSAMPFFQDQLHDVFAREGWRNDGSGRLPEAAELLKPILERNGAKQNDAFAIVGATIHPVSGPAIENGTLVIRDGAIESVGASAADLDGVMQIEAAGLHVYPGMINAATTVGMHEIDSTAVTVDENEIGRFQPDIHATSAVNPHSRMIDITREVGILAVVDIPSGPFVAGQAGLLHLDGWTMPEMVADSEVALVVNLPSRQPAPLVDNRPERFKKRIEERNKRVKNQQREIREFFENAQRYAAMRKAGSDADPLRSRYEAMLPYIRGDKPVMFAANSYKEILEALMFAKQFELRPIILGGREAWKCADILAADDVPVIYEGVMPTPREMDAWDANYRAAGRLAAAGVKFCFAHRSADLAKQMPTEAGFAVAHGLAADDALRATTLGAAEILGVAEQLGSLDEGKIANVIVTTGHPCQATTRVIHAFVRGKPVAVDSAHSRMAEEFADRPAADLPEIEGTLRGGPMQSTR